MSPGWSFYTSIDTLPMYLLFGGILALFAWRSERRARRGYRKFAERMRQREIEERERCRREYAERERNRTPQERQATLEYVAERERLGREAAIRKYGREEAERREREARAGILRLGD
jgi:hypothetical protein